MPVTKADFIKKVGSYFPSEAIDFVFYYFDNYDFNLKISRPRKTKKGDFVFMRNRSKRPQISVNSDLCSYEFLLVFLHELAHYFVYLRYPSTVKSHGQEWKAEYRQLVQKALNTILLPEEVKAAFRLHITHVKSTSNADENLEKCFDAYRPANEEEIFLKDLNLTDQFIFRHHYYQLLSFARTRAICVDLSTHLQYRIGKMARVEKVENI